MPSKINQELVRAFNIVLCENDIGITNFTVQNVRQSLRNKDHIVISFDKSMDADRCMRYLDDMKERIVETFCGSESTASLSFDIKFPPFEFDEKQLVKDDKGGYKFSVPIDQGITFNLKCLLAHGLVKDVKEGIGENFSVEYAKEHGGYDVRFDRNYYLHCMRFEKHDKNLQDYFVESFSSRVKDYKNSPKKTGDFLKVKDNCVYIKASIFDNVEFIREVVKRKASLICRDFQVPSSEDEVVESLKFPVIDLFYEIGIPVDFILHTSYTGHSENSVLVPMIQITPGIGGKENCRFLNKEEVNYVNRAFSMDVLRNVQDCTSLKHLPVFGNRGVYGIDFYDKDISYCVLNKIMESSVINKDHELSIDPELHFRALSPAQSPFNSPMHAGPSGIRTPPNQRRSIDSGIGESPPKPKDSGSSSGDPSSGLTELSSPTQEFPTRGRSQDGVLGESPRQWSEREEETGRMSQLVLGEIDPSQPTCGQSQLSLTCRPPSIPFPIAWDNSISLNFGVSEDSPKDTENICNEEHKEQKVIGKSDQKSSDECSEAKSQESESPEKHGGGLFCKKGMPILAKLSPFKRRSVERDTMCSSKSDLVYHVTEKSSVSKPFFSFPTRIRAKSNPPSEVTSPTHEGGSEWQQRLDPDQREELCKVLSPEMNEKLNSGFFLPRYEKLLHLLYVDSETLRSLLSTSEGAEQVCSVLPPEKGKQLHSDLPFKTKKGLLFKFFDDEQEISRNVSTSSADSGCYSGSSSQKSTSDTGSDKDKLEASGGFSQSGRLSVSSSPSSKSVSSVIKKVRVGSLFSLEAGK